jgi:hypothetical protein
VKPVYTLIINKEAKETFDTYTNIIQTFIKHNAPVPSQIAKNFLSLFMDPKKIMRNQLEEQASDITVRALERLKKGKGYILNEQEIHGLKQSEDGFDEPLYHMPFERMIFATALDYLKYKKDKDASHRDDAIYFFYSVINDFNPLGRNNLELLTNYKKIVLIGILTLESFGQTTSELNLSNKQIFLLVTKRLQSKKLRTLLNE